MRIHIHLDFETFGVADLKNVGAYAYASDGYTDCLLASYAIADRPVKRWRPGDPYPFKHLASYEIHAWNSQFERLIWTHIMTPVYGWPALPLTAFICTSAQARLTSAAPAKLEAAALFLDRPFKKDMRGHRHMLKMCRPADDKTQNEWMRRNPGRTWDDAKRCHHTPLALNTLHNYCDLDVEAERDIARVLPAWRDDDLLAFWESERINDHGLVVDVDFAKVASDYADEEKAYFNWRIAELTDNVVTTPRQFQRIKEWALPRMPAAAVKITEFYEDGIKKNSFDADTRSNLLNELSADADFMDADLAEFVQLLDLAGKSTIAKYQAIASRAVDGLTDNNPRVHGAYMFAGAAQSGRYSSPGIQVHNMVRKVPEDASRIIAAFKHRCVGRQFGEPLHLLGQLVRPTITGDPDDRFDLVWCDWSSVEAMVLPWLTLDAGADDRLEAFRRGEDIYLKTASRIAGRTITKADAFERNCFGKVPELSLGYCGGAGAFKSMMKNYSVHLPEKQIVEIVKTWRAQNPWAMAFGDGLEQAAMNAIRYPGSSYSHGRIGYVFDEDALDGIGALYAVLPSGRKLCYPNARIDVVRTPYGRDGLQITAMKGAWHPKRGEKEWPRVGIWKGLLVENACQAIATADLLNASLLRARQKYRLTVAGHTHDEILIETPDPERDAKRLLECMLEKPDWPGIDALPLRAEVDCGFRYKVKF